MAPSTKLSRKFANAFLDFVNASPTRVHLQYTPSRLSILTVAAFHAVKSSRELLEDAGFKEIKVCQPLASS
jgi:hypothetical protein